MSPFIFAVTLAFAILALGIIRRRYFHPLSRFPGPFLGSVTSLYQTYWHVHPNKTLHDAELHKKYGPIVRYSPNGLIVNDPALLPVIYNRRANKTDFYAPVFDTHSTFTRKDYREHVASRKAIS
ncbi:hypothetical protein RU639_013508 [Aspergillus parasiticus]